MPIRTPLLAALLVFAGSVLAEAMPVVPGERAWAHAPTVVAHLRLPPGAAKSRALLPAVTEAEVATVRAANQRDTTKPRPRRLIIGLDRGLQGALAAAANLPWVEVAGGHAAQVAVTSPEAGALRLAIDLKGVAADVEMVFFGSDARRLEGPVRVGDIRDRSAAWISPLTEGETQTVEFFVPGRSDPAKAGMRVLAASHLFTTPSSGFTKRLQDIGSAGSCNVDVVCSPLNNTSAFRDASAAVAQLVFRDGGFTGLCTGSLLADSDPATQVPWLYSANHCFDNEDPPYKTPSQMQVVANTLSTIWMFQADNCADGTGSGVPEATWSQVFGGSALAYSSVQSDALLVRLNGTPPAGAFFSGWNANAIGSGTAVTSIHHPQGDLKKVTRGSVLGFSAPGLADGDETFIEVSWFSGTTEQGSSGGGLWSVSNGQYFLRGGLWAGTALCTNLTGTDNFSRFDHVYPNLVQYLGPAVTPAADFTDLWWGGPSESGWGLNIVQHPSNIIFGVWYTYEADGTRTWYVIPTGSWSNSMTYTGPLYTATGPAYSGFFDPSQVAARLVGNATINFTSTGNGIFTFVVDGISGSKLIQRQSF